MKFDPFLISLLLSIHITCSIKSKANMIKCNQVQYSSSFCNKDNVVNETLQQHVALQMMKKEIANTQTQ